jgi:hemolysin III
MDKKQIIQEYKEKKRLLKQEYRNKLEELAPNKNNKPVINPPKRSVMEEIGNAVTHGVGSIFAIVACVLMFKKSNTDMEYFSTIVYSFGLFIMFTMSCLYHSFRHGSAVKRLFRRFDYSSIYLLIGATFAPLLLCYANDMKLIRKITNTESMKNLKQDDTISKEEAYDIIYGHPHKIV